jgi:uncharacterized protein YjbI with pentapeptide repeats
MLINGIDVSIQACANLSRADLRDADLRRADLSRADLRGADLTCADLRGADLRDANLRGADLSHADLRGADLRDADLRDADLRDAYLFGADLRDADLRDADLRDANLSHADLRGANGGQRSDGYRFIAWCKDGVLQVRAGCRSFSLPEAREHWERTRGGTALGDETMAILDLIERVALIRGLLVRVGG